MASTCLVDTKKMPLEAGSPLAAGYLSETVTKLAVFFGDPAPAICLTI